MAELVADQRGHVKYASDAMRPDFQPLNSEEHHGTSATPSSANTKPEDGDALNTIVG